MKTYEGMFLIDSKEAKKGSDAIEETIKGLIEKCKGQVVRFEKWDERRLAYEIDGVINGTYYLYYFTGETDTIGSLNREIQLSSNILRALFLKIKEVPEVKVPETDDAFDDDEGEDSEGGGKRPFSTDSSDTGEDESDTVKSDTGDSDAGAEDDKKAGDDEETASEESAAEAPAEEASGDEAPAKEDADSDKPEG